MTDLKTKILSKNAIIFDMDGTIVNTEGLHAKAASLVLKDMGIKIDLEAVLHQFYGMTDVVVLKTMCPELSEVEVKNAIDKKNIRLIEMLKIMSKEEKEKYITPGLFEFLNFLKLKNKKMAVVSASEDIVVTETLLGFNIASFIEIQMGRSQTSRTKPHSDPYIEGMKRLGVSPSEAIIFEDSPTGLQSASGTGAETIRITAFTHNQKKSEFIEIENFLNLFS